jgi:hypothetical protein
MWRAMLRIILLLKWFVLRSLSLLRFLSLFPFLVSSDSAGTHRILWFRFDITQNVAACVVVWLCAEAEQEKLFSRILSGIFRLMHSKQVRIFAHQARPRLPSDFSRADYQDEFFVRV